LAKGGSPKEWQNVFVDESAMTKDTNNKRGKVLGSYQKVGAKFIPPMLQNFKMEHVSWDSQTMPELIWWDVLFDMAPRRFAAKVAEGLARYFKGHAEQKHWWGFTSNYAHLSDEGVARLRAYLSDERLLNGLTECMSNFLELYPSCPVARLLGWRASGAIDIAYLSRFEDRVRVLENKRSRNGVLIQAQAIYMAFLSDRFKVAEGLALANFPEVEHYPDTEESLRVGAAVCATVNMMAGESLAKYSENRWVQYFWNRSLELRPMNFDHLTRK
jgi:hypothetical protein